MNMETILPKNVLELINIIPNSYFQTLAAQTQVDYKVHKLQGKTIFQLLLYGVLTQTRLSFNVLVSVFDHVFFRQLSHLSADFYTAKNSLADRLATMKVNYFADLFTFLQQKLNHSIAYKEANFGLLRFDSTIVSLFSQLLKIGMHNGGKAKDPAKLIHQIKITIGFDGLIVTDAQVYTTQTYLSEEIALKETILQSAYSTKDIVVFDRGLQNRFTFANFSNENILFVTRLKLNSSFEVLHTCSNCENRQTDSLTLLSDQIVYLCSAGRIVKNSFRLIKAVRKTNQEEIWFLTNNLELSAKQITAIYCCNDATLVQKTTKHQKFEESKDKVWTRT